MGSDVSAKAEAVSELARPARYVADSDSSPARDGEVRAKRETREPPKKTPARKNRLRETRIEKMMSKAELARRANLSVLTIDRVEKGLGCRMDTKRKILEALGLSLADRVRVFGEEE
jgi:DNA-binding XRE family transcriptional regulator